MAMTREARVALHGKQERVQIRRGVPNTNNLKEGIPELRDTSQGLVEYIKHNGILYKKVWTKA